MVGIKFVGSGGQGVILAGLILGKAAAIYEKKEAVFTESYGAETRGGFSSSSVVISDEKIDYPYVLQPDILVAFSQQGYDSASDTLKSSGILIYENDLVNPKKVEKMYGIPATRLAREKFNKTTSVNMIMLGFLVARTGIVSKESLIRAVEESVPRGTEKENLDAVRLGYNYSSQ
ncbi:MAG: 2-oxoacid:ferredoxin oxidoreductase subunit gamma [Euryarchaeota archaeon]|jgi:2-oxoglutarate ferredoxin oxidoreductase subunit gamma|nr:2-oxoacid:acceptor oxidoreductase family protein [Thermoplasmata archaeon]MVT12897.1 2-oxoacid:ferredoxin oxidoreductase subunit gamma [Euryarchaeota archaeon]MVT36443.1 2-oxoacid:ferredoxin oxidoreductase subunit gamma [Euryarchaeota archaeon]